MTNQLGSPWLSRSLVPGKDRQSSRTRCRAAAAAGEVGLLTGQAALDIGFDPADPGFDRGIDRGIDTVGLYGLRNRVVLDVQRSESSSGNPSGSKKNIIALPVWGSVRIGSH